MSLPEIVIQQGVARAWQFIQERDYLLGAMLRTFTPEKQQFYREFVRETSPAILFQNPSTTPVLPCFIIQLLGENEEQAYVGDQGMTVQYTPEALKYPPPQPEDFRRDGYYGLDYNLRGAPELDNKVRYIQVGGDRSKDESEHHPVIGQNTGIQRAGGDEQYERVDYPARLFNALTDHISTLAVQDRVQMGIEVNGDSAEQTYVLYRILKPILQRFHTFFHVNGVQNPTFSGSELSVNEQLQPTGGGPGAFRRLITMSFQHEVRNHTIDQVLAGWMLEVGLVTKRADGSDDEVVIATVGPTNVGSKVSEK